MYGNLVTRLPVITPSRTSTLVLGKKKCNKTLAARTGTKGGKEEGRQELYIICHRNVPLSLISVGKGGTFSLVQLDSTQSRTPLFLVAAAAHDMLPYLIRSSWLRRPCFVFIAPLPLDQIRAL